jgi:hypothetical protein
VWLAWAAIVIQQWWLVLVWVGITALDTIIFIYGLRSYRVYRRAEKDRGSTGPGGGSLYSAIALYSTRSYTTETFSTGVIEEVGDEPYKAWKWAYLTDMRSDRFTPVNAEFNGYGVEAVARCGYHRVHRAPELQCTCGFYGMNDRALANMHGEIFYVRRGLMDSMLSVQLEVEFYGKVIVCEYGYRAEKLRVLGMYVPDIPEARQWKEQHPVVPATEWRWMEWQ